MPKKIAVIVGSLRKASFNRSIAQALIQFAPDSLQLEPLNIGQLPHYNQDEDEHPPAAWVAFRESIKQADGILFVTPEYNRSVPGVLKNAIDVGSRPYGQSVWNGKPAAVVSASISAIGGFGANQHLRQSLTCLNMPCLPAPEVYIGDVTKLLDDQGRLVNEGTQKFLTQFMQTFAQWVAIHTAN